MLLRLETFAGSIPKNGATAPPVLSIGLCRQTVHIGIGFVILHSFKRPSIRSHAGRVKVPVFRSVEVDIKHFSLYLPLSIWEK